MTSSVLDHPAIQKALEFARKAHGLQKRKYTHEPYIEHPLEVLQILLQAGEYDLELLQAALLHDVVEDTHIVLDDIRREFGLRVADYVEQLTNVSRPEDGPRSYRKALDLEHLKQAGYEGASIKLADIISNTQNIARVAPEFAKTYLQEKKAQLAVLMHGNGRLWRSANQIIMLNEMHMKSR